MWFNQMYIAAHMADSSRVTTNHTNNWPRGTFPGFSSYYFVTDSTHSRNIVLTQGDISDVSKYQDTDLVNSADYKAFTDDFYNNEPYFQMDVIEMTFKSVGLVHQENGKYHYYGYVANMWHNGIDKTTNPDFPFTVGVVSDDWSSMVDPLSKYTKYAMDLPTSTGTYFDEWLALRSQAIITPESFGWPMTYENQRPWSDIVVYGKGFSVFFVNKNLLDASRKVGTIVCTVPLVYPDGSRSYDWLSSGDLTDAEKNLIGPMTVAQESTKTLDGMSYSKAYQPIFIIPYEPAKLKMATGTDGTNVYTSPKVNITFDFSNVLTKKNMDYCDANGTLALDRGRVSDQLSEYYDTEGAKTQILLNQHDANGNEMLPFNLQIGFEEQAMTPTE